MKHSNSFLRKILLFVLAAALLFCTSCGNGDTKATTMYLVKTTGSVGVTDGDGASVALLDRLGLYSGYVLESQSDSFAWIDLDDTKLAKMDEKSNVGIAKDGRELEIFVNSGSLFFHVTEPLKDDESMEIRTSAMICGIRGTCGWVTAGGGESCLYLLDGTVECTVLTDGHEETVTVNANENLTVKEDGGHVTYEIRALTPDDMPSFVQDEIADEPFALAAAGDAQTADNAQTVPDGQTEGDAASGTEADSGMPTDTEGDAQNEDAAETVPGESISISELVGRYARENTDNTHDALLDFGAYSDVDYGEGGPFRVYIDNDGSSIDMAAFDGEWMLSSEELPFRDGVTYRATDADGNILSFVPDAGAAGMTISVEYAATDDIHSAAGHYVIQERFEMP